MFLQDMFLSLCLLPMFFLSFEDCCISFTLESLKVKRWKEEEEGYDEKGRDTVIGNWRNRANVYKPWNGLSLLFTKKKKTDLIRRK